MEKKRENILYRIEEALIVLIIILGIMDFFEILPGDLDYTKKIISWSIMGYLLYKASPTAIFFNKRKALIDLILIISYFLLIFKNLIVFVEVNTKHSFIFYELQKAILENAVSIEIFTFFAGSILLLLLSLYCAFRIEIMKPSLLHIIHEEGPPPKDAIRLLFRFMSIFLVFLSFFIVVFNLMMEWLAIAVDAPIVILGIVFYLFIVMRHYKRYDAETLIFKIGDFGEDFYSRFISMFHYKKTIFLGISGILVLHLLTDVGNFILPYMTTLRDHLYFEHLGSGHDPLITLFIQQAKTLGLTESISLALTYILNLFAILFLLLIPAVLWYVMFKDTEMWLSNSLIALFFSALSALAFSPVFRIKKIVSENLLGIDIQTQFASNFLPSFLYLILLCLAVFLSVLALSRFIKRLFISLIIISGLSFFTYYIYLFFMSLWEYYIIIIKTLFLESQYFLWFYFILFLTITIAFYICGLIIFLYENISAGITDKIR